MVLKRSSLRRGKPLPLLAVVVCAAIVAVVITKGALRMTRSDHSVSNSPNQQKSEVVTEVDRLVEADPGAWMFGDRATPWSADVARRQDPVICTGSADRVQFSEVLYASGVDRVGDSIAAVLKEWHSAGYSTQVVVPSDQSNDDFTEVAATTELGTVLTYSASRTIRSITADSSCFPAPDHEQ